MRIMILVLVFVATIFSDEDVLQQNLNQKIEKNNQPTGSRPKNKEEPEEKKNASKQKTKSDIQLDKEDYSSPIDSKQMQKKQKPKNNTKKTKRPRVKLSEKSNHSKKKNTNSKANLNSRSLKNKHIESYKSDKSKSRRKEIRKSNANKSVAKKNLPSSKVKTGAWELFLQSITISDNTYATLGKISIFILIALVFVSGNFMAGYFCYKKLEATITNHKPLTILPHKTKSMQPTTNKDYSPYPWSYADMTIKGNVAEQNEDYTNVFAKGDIVCALVADGLGGEGGGKEASFLAVQGATQFLKNYHGCISEKTISMAMYSAACEIEEYKEREQTQSKVRTTLLAAICTPEKFYYGFVGDGGIATIDNNANVKLLLDPQEGGITHMMSSCISHEVEGKITTGSQPRKPGDMILLATDGVSDKCNFQDLPLSIQQKTYKHKGNLKRSIEAIIDKLQHQKNKSGKYICDDNMSIAVVANGVPQKGVNND